MSLPQEPLPDNTFNDPTVQPNNTPTTGVTNQDQNQGQDQTSQNNGNQGTGNQGNTGGQGETQSQGENQTQNQGQNGNGISQDECTNQFPLPPSSLPTGSAPNVDETHFGVNLEFTPVIDIVVNKPKLRLANFANGNFSTKCYRQ